jgi:hypothetical protein
VAGGGRKCFAFLITLQSIQFVLTDLACMSESVLQDWFSCSKRLVWLAFQGSAPPAVFVIRRPTVDSIATASKESLLSVKLIFKLPCSGTMFRILGQGVSQKLRMQSEPSFLAGVTHTSERKRHSLNVCSIGPTSLQSLVSRSRGSITNTRNSNT